MAAITHDGYVIGASPANAGQVAYNNTSSGMTADDVQEAIDELHTSLASKQNTLTFDDVPTNGSNNPVKSDGIYDALATRADLTDLAPAFSTSIAYTVGQYVSYNGNIYKCTSAHSVGAWVAGDFTLVAVASELETKQNATDNNLHTTSKTVAGAINEVNDKVVSMTSTVSAFGQGTTLKFNITSISDQVWHFLAFGTAIDNMQEGYIRIRDGGGMVFNKVIIGSYTLSHDYASIDEITITLPQEDLWDYSMTLVPMGSRYVS